MARIRDTGNGAVVWDRDYDGPEALQRVRSVQVMPGNNRSGAEMTVNLPAEEDAATLETILRRNGIDCQHISQVGSNGQPVRADAILSIRQQFDAAIDVMRSEGFITQEFAATVGERLSEAVDRASTVSRNAVIPSAPTSIER